jgi:hypothetical protein
MKRLYASLLGLLLLPVVTILAYLFLLALPAAAQTPKCLVVPPGGGAVSSIPCPSGGGGSGTVTSVGVTSSDGSIVPTGSPVTTSGVIDLTVNASNISTGVLPAARLPAPTASTFGGVRSLTCSASQWLNSLATTGVFACARPAAADVSGLAASATTDTTNAANISSGTLPAARLPTPTASTLGGVQSLACSLHQWLNSLATTGVLGCAQPAAADVSGLAASATTDATNASNIATGTLNLARLGSQSANCVIAGPASGGAATPTCRALVSADLPATSPAAPATPQGRLTLVTGTPVIAADQTAKSTLYYPCFRGKLVPYFDGTTDQADTISGCEVSDAMQASGTGVLNASGVFDVWWVHSGANRLCVATDGSGGGWAADTAGSNVLRGTGYSAIHNTRGYYTNTNALAHCYNGSTDYGSIAADRATYLGSIYTTAAGQTGVQMFPTPASGGSAPIVGIWNAYNREPIAVTSIDNGGSYTYGTATWRSVRASNANRLTGVWGFAAAAPRMTFSLDINDANNCGLPGIGIAIDSTTAAPTTFGTWRSCGFGSGLVNVELAGALPQVGLHYFQAMELGGAGGAFNGVSNAALVGRWEY